MAPTSNHGKICYLQIPAADVAASARFYSEESPGAAPVSEAQQTSHSARPR